MTIRNAWTIPDNPDQFIIETQTGLYATNIAPFRTLEDSDLEPYRGIHPRKLHGVPMPEQLYKFYGLEKDEAATEVIHVRVTPTDKAAIEARAKAAGLTVVEFVRRAALNFETEQLQIS